MVAGAMQRRVCAECGTMAEPVVIVPGVDGDTCFLPAAGAAKNVADFRLTRPRADRVFCSIDPCARLQGWPWLAALRQTPIRRIVAS